MSEQSVILAAQAAVQSAQSALGEGAPITDLLVAVTVAYGYTRGKLERLGIPDGNLDMAEEVAGVLARRTLDISDQKARERMPQA